MLKLGTNFLSRNMKKGFAVKNYALAAIGRPALFKSALDRVLLKRSRAAESIDRAEKKKASLEKRALLVRPDVLPKSLDELLAGLAQNMGVLLLAHDASAAVIGVAEVDLLSALVDLETNAPGLSMRINRKAVTFQTKGFERLALTAPDIEISHFDSKFNGFCLTIEPYCKQAPGKWLSNNPRNLTARALYLDLLETPGLHDVASVLMGPTIHDRAKAQPVDVVYTWVNHSDPDWAAMYAEHRRSEDGETESNGESVDAQALSRFHSNDELRYSLRSVAANLPWVNKIYVFTNCAKPDWITTESDKLIWVQHSDVIPSEFLPSFNSHVIESFLHRIPGLSEDFIYINDDVFVARQLKKAFFFDLNGSSRSFMEPYAMISGPARIGDPDYLNASRNSARILNAALGFVPTQLHRHTTFALRRSVLNEIEQRFSLEINQMRKSRFRQPTDINLTSFFYHHYAAGTGRAMFATCASAFVKSLDIRWKAQLAAATAPNLDIICINEGGAESPAADWHGSVRDFLMKRFPVKAPWER